MWGNIYEIINISTGHYCICQGYGEIYSVELFRPEHRELESEEIIKAAVEKTLRLLTNRKKWLLPFLILSYGGGIGYEYTKTD
jgi:hypothetical protein